MAMSVYSFYQVHAMHIHTFANHAYKSDIPLPSQTFSCAICSHISRRAFLAIILFGLMSNPSACLAKSMNLF